MRPHTPEEARHVVALAERFQALTLEILGRVSVFASDEFYLVAGATPPSAATFESLDQAENGIGLVAAFVQSFVDQTPHGQARHGLLPVRRRGAGARLPRAARRRARRPTRRRRARRHGRIRRAPPSRDVRRSGIRRRANPGGREPFLRRQHQGRRTVDGPGPHRRPRRRGARDRRAVARRLSFRGAVP